MHKDRLKFAIGLGFTLLLVIYFFKWKSPDEKTVDLSTETMGQESQSPSFQSNTQFEKAKMFLQNSKPDEERLNQWLDEHSLSMSSFSPKDQDQLENFVARLKPSDYAIFKTVSLSTKQPIQKRILATYVLILGENQSSKEISEFIKAPLEAPPNPAPHSIDESTAGREKAIRVMAIDALALRAKANPAAKEELKQMIPDIKDSWVRSYAEKKLREL